MAFTKKAPPFKKGAAKKAVAKKPVKGSKSKAKLFTKKKK